MHIKKVEIKNYIGIEEKNFDAGKINYITGRKGCGKSSIIEALEKAFTNKNRRTEVVRHGEDEATIFVQLDDGLEITRKIRTTGKSDYLRVRKEGEAVPSTETFLRKLVTGDIFRPLEFVNKSPDEQAKILLDMLKIDWTFDDIQNWFGEIPDEINYHQHILKILKQIENKYYEEREAINREIKFLSIQVKSIKDELPPNYDGEYWRAQKVQEYYKKVAEAEEINKKIANARAIIDSLEARIQNIKSQAEIERQKIKAQNDKKRQEIKEHIRFLTDRIATGQEFLAKSDNRIKAKELEIEKELQAEIERIKVKYELKKQEEIQRLKEMDAEAERKISRYNNDISIKEQELKNIDILEQTKLESIDKSIQHQIEVEKAKAGNAEEILKNNQEINVEPLRKEADKVAEMQSYLREYDRMVQIIKEKLAPREQRSADLTAKIEMARKLPMELLKTAQVPVQGLEIDGNGRIRINGTLIDGLSEGEQLELAFKVAKAQAGELKAICLDGINKINPEDRKWIEEEMAKDDFQYFVLETSDGELTIEILE